MARDSGAKEKFVEFLTMQKGTLFVVNGTTLSMNIAHLCLCELMLKNRCTNSERISIISSDDDPNCKALLNRHVSVILERLFTNSEIARRRIDAVNGLKVSNSFKEMSIPASMFIREIILGKQVPDIFVEVEKQVEISHVSREKDVFVFPRISPVNPQSIMKYYRCVSNKGCNLWIQLPNLAKDEYYEWGKTSVINGLIFYISSMFLGMEKDNTYSIRADVKDVTGKPVIQNVRLSL